MEKITSITTGLRGIVKGTSEVVAVGVNVVTDEESIEGFIKETGCVFNNHEEVALFAIEQAAPLTELITGSFEAGVPGYATINGVNVNIQAFATLSFFIEIE